MAAPEGNTNAERWTEEVAVTTIEQAIENLNGKCYFISELADSVDVYSQWFKRMVEKFPESDVVYTAVKRLYTKAEATITRKTAESEIVPALGIFILKSYHDLVETSKVQQEHSGEVGVKQITGMEIK